MRIFLIGFMGSGKSHVGRQLAKAAQMPFLDLDDYMEQHEQRSITSIFAQEGEAAFRQMERAALHRTAELPEAVIACGGGTPCFFDNMDWMNRHGVTVYLKTPVDILFQRLKAGKNKRPLLATLDDAALQNYISNKLNEREPFYLQAGVIYHVQQLHEPVANELFKTLKFKPL